MGSQRVGHDWATELNWTELKWFSMHACIGEGNGNPLQYSCLENPRDRRAWWAAISGVAQNQTWLKRLSSSSSRNSGEEVWAECCLMREGSSVGYQRQDYVNSLMNEKCCCHIRKQGCYGCQATTAAPETAKTLSHCSHANSAPWGDSGWKRTGYWPQIAKTHIKGMMSMTPDSYIFPFTRDCYFSLMVVFWCSNYLVFVAKHLI